MQKLTIMVTALFLSIIVMAGCSSKPTESQDTKDKYNKLEIGMHPDEVQFDLDVPVATHEEVSGEATDGTQEQWNEYTYDMPDGFTITCDFYHLTGELTNKKIEPTKN